MPAPRRRRVTISTVARRAGRSVSTVSAALNNAPGVASSTRQEIRDIAHQLGYEADPKARLLRRASTGLIGVSFVAGQAFQVELVDALYAACERRGRDIALSAVTGSRDETEGVRGLLRERCESLVLVDSAVEDALLREAAAVMPVVLLCHDTGVPGVDVVRSQDDVGVRALVEHLLSTGRRRLVHIDGGGASAAPVRPRVFTEVLAERGLPASVVAGGDDEESGTRAASALAARGVLPQALVCFNDRCALGAVLELRRRGLRVPEDVAVTGYDGIPFSGLSALDLTTVRQDAPVIADVAVRRAVAGMESMADSAGSAGTVSRPSGGGGPEADPDQGLPGGLPAGVVVDRLPGGGAVYSVRPHLLVRGSSAPSS